MKRFFDSSSEIAVGAVLAGIVSAIWTNLVAPLRSLPDPNHTPAALPFWILFLTIGILGAVISALLLLIARSNPRRATIAMMLAGAGFISYLVMPLFIGGNLYLGRSFPGIVQIQMNLLAFSAPAVVLSLATLVYGIRNLTRAAALRAASVAR